MIYSITVIVFVILATITILYFIGKDVKKKEVEVVEKMKEAKVKKKRFEKLKSYSRANYAKVPAVKKNKL